MNFEWLLSLILPQTCVAAANDGYPPNLLKKSRLIERATADSIVKMIGGDDGTEAGGRGGAVF